MSSSHIDRKAILDRILEATNNGRLVWKPDGGQFIVEIGSAGSRVRLVLCEVGSHHNGNIEIRMLGDSLEQISLIGEGVRELYDRLKDARKAAATAPYITALDEYLG